MNEDWFDDPNEDWFDDPNEEFMRDMENDFHNLKFRDYWDIMRESHEMRQRLKEIDNGKD